jgi:alcohol dehydrogenase
MVVVSNRSVRRPMVLDVRSGFMKAVVIERQGSVDNLVHRDWPDPELRAGDVIVAVKAVGMNHLDIFVRRGMPGFPVKMPFISGGDISGFIVDKAPDVTGWNVGDRVALNPMTPEGMIGEQIQGGMAELVRVPATHLVRIPEGIDYVTAAAVPINFGTSLRMLEAIAKLQRDELVLIYGASGGVGTASIQISQYMGARVIAVTRGKTKAAALAEKLAPDYVIDSKITDVSAEAWKISDKKGVNLVINNTGGETWVPSLRAMGKRARLVTCGATAGFDPKTDIRYIWKRELQILGSNGYTQQDIERSFDLVGSGKMRPLVSHVLDATEARRAHLILEDREVIGKVVVTFNEGRNP